MQTPPDDEQPISDAELDTALDELSDPARFAAVEERIARLAPKLQRILNSALASGGWFDEAREGQILRAGTTPDEDVRIAEIRTMLAEETRMGMMVGVAVGWELAERLRPDRDAS